jgi:hypothetical protein
MVLAVRESVAVPSAASLALPRAAFGEESVMTVL